MYDGFLGGLLRRYGWRKVQIGLWGLAVSGILVTVPLMVFRSLAGTLLSGVLALSGVIMFIYGAIGAIIAPNRRRRYSVFDAALLGASPEELPLVVDQPDPDIAALALPANIDLRTRKPLARLAAIITWMFLFGMTVVSRGLIPLFSTVLLTSAIVTSLVKQHHIAVGMDDQKVRVDEDGVVVQSADGAKRLAILWDDVRIFALTQEKGILQTTKCYMLSSGDHEVRWEYRLSTP